MPDHNSSAESSGDEITNDISMTVKESAFCKQSFITINKDDNVPWKLIAVSCLSVGCVVYYGGDIVSECLSFRMGVSGVEDFTWCYVPVSLVYFLRTCSE